MVTAERDRPETNPDQARDGIIEPRRPLIILSLNLRQFLQIAEEMMEMDSDMADHCELSGDRLKQT